MAESFHKLVVLLLLAFTQVRANLEIDIKPSSKLYAVKGRPVKIDCIVTGAKTTPTVTWKFQENPVVTNSDIKVFPNNTLYISSFSRTYKGTYSCEAKTQDDNKYAVVQIDMAVLRKLPPIPDDYELVSRTVNITCLKPTRANPPPTVTWEIDGKPLPMDSRYKVQGWSLVISNLQTSDTNNYTCVVANLAAVRKQTMKLQVYVAGRVEVLPKNSEVLEGKSIWFNCKSFSSPPFPSQNIQWSKTDKKSTVVLKTDSRHTILSNGTLKITSLVPSDKGKYECRFVMAKLSSLYRDIAELKIFEKVKINKAVHQNQQNLDRIVNKSHAVHCSFTGTEPITVTWSKQGLSTLPARMKPNGDTLIIKDLKLSDSGKYQCKIQGKYNSIMAAVNVYVYDGPQFTTIPKNITIKEGETGKTVCIGKAVPKPKTSWVRADVSANQNLPANFKILNNSTLVIEKAEESNSGSYFCVLANGYTSNSVVFYVNVEKSGSGKGRLKGGQQSMGRTVGIAVGCAGAYIVLVIGLMIYCRRRRSRLLKKQGNAMTEIEDGEFNKDLLGNGDDEFALNGDLKNLEKWKFPREGLQELNVLGHGKLGKVCTAKARDICEGSKDTLVAVKHLAKINEACKEAFDRELDMLTQLNHDHVIKLLGICIDDYPLLIITEYSEQGNLKECLTGLNKHENMPVSLNASKKLQICSQIASGMEYLSVNRIIHQDLACRNCLVVSKDLDVKVAFFSLSEDLYSADYYMYRDAQVPLRWLSPEALFDENYSEKSGVWAFGVVTWEVYSLGIRPYPDRADEEVIKRLRKDLTLYKPNGCPDELYSLMMNCCRINPDERPKFSEIVAAIGEIPVDSNV